MAKGLAHKPTMLKSGRCGVYAFVTDTHCLKVGKASSKSQARWNSHHYNLDETAPSTLHKSIIKSKARIKELYRIETHQMIDSLDKSVGANAKLTHVPELC